MQDNAVSETPLVIWRIVDGKPGHDNQTIGLVKALNKKVACHYIDIPAASMTTSLWRLFTARWSAVNTLPKPDLVIGAGHRTHLSMLAAKRIHGGKTVVLMQPSLPLHLFDLCLIPEHDNYQGRGDYIETRGVLNPVQATGIHDENRGLIMIGGPSKHFEWDQGAVLSQLERVLMLHPTVQFQITTSRRTPAEFMAVLKTLSSERVMIVPFEETTKSWVAEQLSQAAMSWVTEDSASMVYEALTAQTAVGVLSMPAKKDNRLSRGIRQLIQNKVIVRFDVAGSYKPAMKPAIGFMEADRCANHILTRWSETAVVTATSQLV